MQKLLKISQQTLWQVVAKGLSILTGFLIIGVVSRTYGEAGTGQFTLALVYLGLFYVLADFSLNAHLLHDLSESSWRKFLGTRLVWSTLLLLSSVIITFLLPANFTDEFKLAVYLGCLSIVFYGLNMTTNAYFQRVLKYQYDILPTILASLAGGLTVLYLASLKLPVYLLVLSYVVMWLVHGSGTYLYVSKIINNIRPLFDLKFSWRLFKEIWPMAAALIVNVVYFRADAFILSYFRSAAEVGIYNVAYQIFQVILVLPTLIMNSFYPILLSTLKESANSFAAEVKKTAGGLLMISLSISVVIYLLAPSLIHLLTGQGFAGSVATLQILSLGFPAFFLSSLGLLIMMAKKAYQQMLVVYFLGLIFNLAANLTFIPLYSYPAAAWVTTISEYLILGMQLVVLWLDR